MKTTILGIFTIVLLGCPAQDEQSILLDTKAGQRPAADVTAPPADLGRPVADAANLGDGGIELPDTSGPDGAGGDDTDGSELPPKVDVPEPPKACQTAEDCIAELGELGPCQTPLCEDGTCFADGLPNGSACDDGDACTTDDACMTGQCQGASRDCDDTNPCTEDTCDPVSGQCQSTPLDLVPCDDLDPCTTPDVCLDGTCTGKAADCPPCTSNADCAPLEDDDLCNGVLVCEAGECVVDLGTVVDCSGIPTGPCQSATCLPVSGHCALVDLEDGDPCTSQNPCKMDGFCASGLCTGPPVICSDSNPCTDDGCDPLVGCQFLPTTGAPCTDGDACTAQDTCTAGVCTGVPIFDCNDENPCTADTCDVTSGACKHEPTSGACDDSNPCTDADQCVGGLCLAGAPLDCSDGEACTLDTCDPAIGGCVSVAKTCDDGNACTIDSCDPQSGVCLFELPGKACLVDAGCQSEDVCAVGFCNACGFCEYKLLVCPNTEQCVEAKCVAGLGCLYTPLVGTPCEDGDPCTGGDTCAAGACFSGSNICAVGTADNPGASCSEIRDADPEANGTGVYWLLGGPNGAFEAYCDMDSDGGGWMLVAHIPGSMPVCALTDDVGSPNDLLSPVSGKAAVLGLDKAGAVPFAGEIRVAHESGVFIYSSADPAWTWAAVASGIINASNPADYGVMGAKDGGSAVPIGFQGCVSASGHPCLLGGSYLDQGYGIVLGIGSYQSGAFKQNAACAATTPPHNRGMLGGAVVGGEGWKHAGTLFIR